MHHLKFEFYLHRYQFNFHQYQNDNGRNFIMHFSHPPLNLSDVTIHFIFNGEPYPVMFGYNFYSNINYSTMEKIVAKANNDRDISGSFEFVIENTGERCEVVVTKTKFKKLILPSDMNVYDHYIRDITRMLESIVNFVAMTNPVNRETESAKTEPEAQEKENFVTYKCPYCATLNRLLESKSLDKAKCGNCGKFLSKEREKIERQKKERAEKTRAEQERNRREKEELRLCEARKWQSEIADKERSCREKNSVKHASNSTHLRSEKRKTNNPYNKWLLIALIPLLITGIFLFNFTQRNTHREWPFFSSKFDTLISKAKKGDIKAQSEVGFMYLKGREVAVDYAEAEKWLRRAAENGDAIAQTNLGQMYDEGLGLKHDYEEALKWFSKAAEKGNVDAQFNMGVMFATGRGVARDYREAVKCFRIAAERGHTKAQSNLGALYLEGSGVVQDYEEAMKWSRKAAERGDEMAQFNIGVMYYKGDGVSRDVSEARKWIRKSAENGNDIAKKALLQM